ncbi:MAG TPA: choice-of-anchor tandem repeat GloVer-containing protein, partial [Verrucomicrobiae bacterium]|nr:choice-of-anchor tandem repeat GloVer-containing protein [Verrucomicrobiae bacterium]
TTLHNFPAMINSTNNDGANPQGGLTVSGSSLYGMSAYGGASGSGTIFKLNTDSSGFATLYNFSAAIDYVNANGDFPVGGLVLSGDTLYGTTGLGGTVGDGTVFQLKTDGSGFLVLYTFVGGSDGYGPAGVTLSGNALYGINFGSSGHARMFSLTLPVASRPSLGITLSGSNVILTWPTNVAGLTLQSTPSLVTPVVWTSVSSGPVVVNGLNTVTNTVVGAQQFYRLSQ